jgi:4-carboxymuconolactone decarboxylase
VNLTNQDVVADLDADFGPMGIEVGKHAWGLPQLTMREKAFVFLAADLAAHNLGFPLRTHAIMARSHGVTFAALREAVRHLAPYIGYPTAAEGLMRLKEIEAEHGAEAAAEERRADPAEPKLDIPPATRERLGQIDPAFAEFFSQQFAQRWNRAELTIRERALCTIAADVLNGTLDESFDLHVAIANSHGARMEQVRAVLLLVAEFGIAKAWRAYQALDRSFGAERDH